MFSEHTARYEVASEKCLSTTQHSNLRPHCDDVWVINEARCQAYV